MDDDGLGAEIAELEERLRVLRRRKRDKLREKSARGNGSDLAHEDYERYGRQMIIRKIGRTGMLLLRKRLRGANFRPKEDTGCFCIGSWGRWARVSCPVVSCRCGCRYG